MNNNFEKFYFENETIPILEEARSKIVIASRHDFFAGTIIPINSQAEDINYNITYPKIGNYTYILRVQDGHKLEEEDKWKAVKNLLTTQETYIQGGLSGEDVIAINFCKYRKRYYRRGSYPFK